MNCSNNPKMAPAILDGMPKMIVNFKIFSKIPVALIAICKIASRMKNTTRKAMAS